MPEYDLISIGDASLDMFLTPSEAESLCEVNTHDCLICFTYGDKIPVKTLEFSIGGNAANNSVGARRLGLKIACVLTLGDDSIGDQIVEKLMNEGVDTRYVLRQKDGESNYSTIIVVGGERTIFSYKPQTVYSFPENLPLSKWIYLTSMGDQFAATYQKVVSWVKENPEVSLAFNPGSRQIRAGVDAIRNVLEVSYAVYVNRQEAEVISGINDSHGKEKDLLNKLSEMGPKISIVTDGSGGAYVYDGEKYLHSGVLPVDSYERTGAGDAFGSGCISALIAGKPMEEALIWGTVNSASVIGYSGAQRGLLKVDQIDEWIERAKSSKVEVREI